MKLEVGKEYLTRDGRKARVVCTDMKNDYSVIALITIGKIEKIRTYTEKGECIIGDVHDDDLVSEYSKWLDVKVDTPVLVWEGVRHKKYKRHFSHYKDGKIFAFNDGKTSWSVDNEKYITSWNYGEVVEN